MYKTYKISENKIVLEKSNFDIIHFFKISEDDKKNLIEQFNIDEHSINSCFDPDEVPRFEIDKDYLNIIWKVPTIFSLKNDMTFNVISVGFFIRYNKLIILSSDFFSYIEEKITIKISSIYDFLLFLQYSTIKHFIEHLKAIKMISRDLQKKINQAIGNEYLIKMFDLSEILIYYLDAINGNKVIIIKLKNYLSYTTIYNDYIQDLINEIDQASKQAEIYSQIFAGLMDARGNIINNNMNVSIKKLTIINIIFLPLNLIASIGGMSEFSSFTKDIPWPISYGLFSLTMVILGWLTYIILSITSKEKKK